MRAPLLAFLLLLPVDAAATGVQEVVLESGATLRAREAEQRGGRWHLVLTSGLKMSLAAERVAAVRPAEGSERASGLNFLGAEPAPPEPRSSPSLDPEGAALFREVERLRAERRFPEAEALLRGELVRRPGDDLRLVLLGRVLVDADRFREALEPLRLAAPDPASTLRRERDLALAEALSRLDRVEEALRVLSATPPDARGEVAALRARLERDRRAGEGLEELSTPRFVVKLPDQGLGGADLRPLVEHLDEAWNELERRLGGAPRERVVVLIQPGDEFWESTGMGRNVGGLYDGKVRVPAGRLDPPSPRLAGVLRHELAHAFVDALTGGRAGTVWHEGIAEHFEGSTVDEALERRLARSWRQGAWPPAYDHATAHSRLEWFLGRWGAGGLRDLLGEWARRGTIDAALEAVTGLDEAELERAWGAALAEKRER